MIADKFDLSARIYGKLTDRHEDNGWEAYEEFLFCEFTTLTLQEICSRPEPFEEAMEIVLTDDDLLDQLFRQADEVVKNHL